MARPLSTKLARRFYGPFEVLERIEVVAYRLQLPEERRIHDVFHVSLLRPYVEETAEAKLPFPSFFARGRVVCRPTKLLDRRTIVRHGAIAEEVLLA